MDQIIQFRILQMWEKIKNMRNSQGYICTNVHLQISTNESDYDEVTIFIYYYIRWVLFI